MKSGEERRLIRFSASNNPYHAYSPTGHIVFVDGVGEASAIWALPFSLKILRATGEPFCIVERGSSPMVSANGTLVYSDVPLQALQMVWCDRSSRTTR